MSGYVIRKMKEAELSIAVDWARKEGWNPGLADASCFYLADPNGFFIGLLDHEPIAVGSAVIYSDTFAFCGLYIVRPDLRKQGFGLRLTKERLKYAGKRVTGIDGVLENVSKYENIGYRVSHQQIRYELADLPSFSAASNLVDAKTIPFQQLEAFDRKFFHAPRSAFLRNWIGQENGHAIGCLKGQHLDGYGVIRKCFQGYKIGPLFAESGETARSLFEALCSKVSEGPVYLDIPEPNREARRLVESYNMTPKFRVMRMYRNGWPDHNVQEGIFGVTTFELG